jgi:hypothetical protein
MPDADRPFASAPPPRDWSDAFAALPLLAPPEDGWRALSARLAAPRPRRRRWPLPLAAAASVLIVAASVWQWRPVAPPALDPDGTPRQTAVDAASNADAVALERMRAESAWLETLHGRVRDDDAASGVSAAVSLELEARVAGIDAALRRPSLSTAEQRALWQARVAALRDATDFETSNRWLATQGMRYDAALVRVD